MSDVVACIIHLSIFGTLTYPQPETSKIYDCPWNAEFCVTKELTV